MVQAAELQKDQFVETFEALRKKGELSWFASARESAIRYFSDRGFPTLRDEEWKYTNVNPIRDTRFHFISGPSRVSSKELNRINPVAIDSHKLVFIDGFFSGELSSVKFLPKGIRVSGLREAEHLYPARVKTEYNPFSALNTAFFRDGSFVCLEEGTVLEKPLELIFVSASDEKIVSFPRTLIVAKPGSKASVIESYLALSQKPYFTNAVTEIIVEEGASVHHVAFQQEGPAAFHVSTTQVNQKKGSVFSSASVDFGGKLVRHNLNVSLDGEGAETHLFGLYLTEDEQHIDNHVFLNHPVPAGTSRELYKGILDGKSTSVFSGKIFVHPDAQKTDAAQTNKNLLLSEEATIDTKPHLEIFADDVKCTHGAAVGQLDEAAVFYFKSRGLDETAARSILCYGFANEVIENIPVESLRAPLGKLVLERLEKRNLR